MLTQALTLDPAGPLDALHTSIQLELLFASPAGRAQHPSQSRSGALHNLLASFTETLPPPSHLGGGNLQE